jgi:small subunit ribosomal protein S7
MRGINHTKYRIIAPDAKYNSELVARFINKVMLDGKKETAKKLVYDALAEAEKKSGKKALEVFEGAIQNASPILEVRSRRIGGANYQVPREVSPKRKIYLSIHWIVNAARSKSGSSFDKLLAIEILEAYENKGAAIKKKEDLHKMAEANRAFAHFGRF